jgi:hypothetical protein
LDESDVRLRLHLRHCRCRHRRLSSSLSL